MYRSYTQEPLVHRHHIDQPFFLEWLHDFLELDISGNPLEIPLRGLACMPKDGGFVLVKASTDL